MSKEHVNNPASRLEHDAAHWITVRLMAVIEPAFRGEELLEFYREAMPIVIEGLKDFAARKAREEERVKGHAG